MMKYKMFEWLYFLSVSLNSYHVFLLNYEPKISLHCYEYNR